MSGTDNTRPHDVVMSDKTIKMRNPKDGVPITGGLNSEGGHAKEQRKLATTTTRQHVRRILGRLRLRHCDPELIEDVDVPIIPDQKHSIGYGY